MQKKFQKTSFMLDFFLLLPGKNLDYDIYTDNKTLDFMLLEQWKASTQCQICLSD